MLDLLILDEGGNPARPSLTTVVNDHSRAIAGYGVFLGATTAQVRQGGGKARPVGAGARSAVLEGPVATRRRQRVMLEVEPLVLGGDTRA